MKKRWKDPYSARKELEELYERLVAGPKPTADRALSVCVDDCLVDFNRKSNISDEVKAKFFPEEFAQALRDFTEQFPKSLPHVP